MKNKAFFFDRDGIVNLRLIDDYIKSIDEFEFIPAFFNIFRAVKQSNYLTVLVTNQQGIGKGLYTDDDLAIIHNYMQDQLLIETGYNFDDIYYCPNLAKDNAECRKPAPGMLKLAANKHNIDFATSFMIGDSISDVKAGKAVGSKTILIGNYSKDEVSEADFIFHSLDEMLEFMMISDLID